MLIHPYLYFTLLSFSQRQALLFADQAQGLQPEGGDLVTEDRDEGHESDWEDEEEMGLRQPPPGEEGFLQSHAGGEAVIQQLMDGITA